MESFWALLFTLWKRDYNALWWEGFPTVYWLFMKRKYLWRPESSSPLQQLLHKYLPQAGKYGTAPIGNITNNKLKIKEQEIRFESFGCIDILLVSRDLDRSFLERNWNITFEWYMRQVCKDRCDFSGNIATQLLAFYFFSRMALNLN